MKHDESHNNSRQYVDDRYLHDMDETLAVPEFIPSREDVFILLEHYIRQDLNFEFEISVLKQTGGSGWRNGWVFVRRRLGRLREVLGAEQYDAACGQILARERARYDPRIWKAMTE